MRLVNYRKDDHRLGRQPVGNEVRIVRSNYFAGSGAASSVSQHGEIAQVLCDP